MDEQKVAFELASYERVVDHRNWALFTQRLPPKGHVDIHREAPRFHPGRFDEVRLYYMGFDAWHGPAGGECVDDGVEDCHWAVGRDGALCPSVVVAPVAVPSAVGNRLMQLFNIPRRDPKRVAMCIPSYHHAFVFYREGNPVGELDLSFDCPRWSASPGFDETYPSADVEAALHEVCDELGLAFCSTGEGSAFGIALQRWEQQHVEHLDSALLGGRYRRVKPSEPLVPADAVLSQLTAAQKLELCVWNTQHQLPIRQPNQTSAGLSFPEHENDVYVGKSLNWPRCIDRFPRCDRSVAEMLPCMDVAQRGDIWFALPAHSRCVPLKECLWGFEALKLTAEKAKEYLAR